MREKLRRRLRTISVDWVMFLALLPLMAAGLVTMYSFAVGPSYYFPRQLLFTGASILLFFVASLIDWRFLRRSLGLFLFYCLGNLVLVGLFVAGHVAKGAQSWFSFAGFSVEPADFVKLLLIIVLAKYFSRRHIEIAHFRHIIVSGVYALIPFTLILLQPDFGSAFIISAIWLGMIVVSGVSKRHLLFVAGTAVVAVLFLWLSIFAPYQKSRIISFVRPNSDTRGAGYNALQSQIAIGSGQIFGKSLGYGTQSRLKFLPEYQTDFIFAAFAEEWGFVGVVILLFLYGVVISRLIASARHGATNFEALFSVGLAILFGSHIFINMGMNIGLLPVTGITLPLLSYGGSHLVVELFGLGIAMGMRRYARPAQRPKDETELVGLVGA